MTFLKKGRARILIVIGVCLLILAAVVIVLRMNPGGSDDPLESISPVKAQRLVRLAREANICLENEQFRDGYEQAEQRYLELKKEIPDSLFAYRNHVIMRILFYENNKEDYQDNEEYIAETTSLIEDLISREPDSFVPCILAVRWRYLVYGDIDGTDVSLLERAIEHAGNSPVPYFEFYEKTSVLDERDYEGLAEKRFRYLARAFELQPDNLKLAMEYLQLLAERKSDDMDAVWATFKDQLSPLVVIADLENFETRSQEFLQQIDGALADRKWGETLLAIRRLYNLVKRGEVFQIDLARIQPHGLELLLPGLEDEIVQRAKRTTESPKRIDPVFAVESTIDSPEPLIAVRVLDFDLDDEVEICALTSKSFLVYERVADGWELLVRTSLDRTYRGFLAADLDLDKKTLTKEKQPEPEQQKISKNYSDPDFVFYGSDGLDVFENRVDADGKRTLAKCDAGDLKNSGAVHVALLVDIDHDKDLDIVAAGESGIRLYLSRGNFSFFDFSRFSVFPGGDRKVTSLERVDLDRDIDIDVLVGFEIGPPGYLENLGHSRLRFRELDPSFGDLTESHQLSALEMDGLPSWDLVSVSASGIRLDTTTTVRSSLQRKSGVDLSLKGFRLLARGDLNNDGYPDLVGECDDRPTIICGGPGKMVLTNSDLPFKVLGLDRDDLDADGLLDLVAISADGNQIGILKNRTSSSNAWLEVSVCGRDSNFTKGRINNHAIGSFVEVQADDYYFATTVDRPRLHFGLGQHQKIDLVRILWNSGMPQSLFKIESGQTIYEEMFEKGSCPYIYTWNGSKFTFFSDCLWAAPLGLQSAPGKFIPCRNWEYLRIPGDRLKPKDGKYILQITEELREAAYFDQVELYAVDHPAEVDIFTNEKVGPPFIAEHRIHTVRSRRPPVQARDMYGQDVLESIRHEDGRYFRGFKDRIAKGLAPLHYLELDFGNIGPELKRVQANDNTGRFLLFLNGWIRPTDCSLNISFSQNPDEPNPIPPVLLVPDADGNWVKRLDPMGFPGGKPKTIVVDLTDVFLCDDYRVRIQTSHEIYWDEVFFAIGESPGEIRQTRLKMNDAHLHYRGFSRRYVPDPEGPELYNYEDAITTPRWPAMTGRFTRYGDVRELLGDPDDCSAVIGAGDEITVSFESIPEPPPGWKRDFVLHLIGYDKDADLNTVTGQSAEPYPFDKMSSYPWGPDESFPDSEKHRKYLDRYQTRKQNWGRYWNSVEKTD